MITRPALRYHGGKFRLAPWIMQFLPEHRVYVEPFGGAASVLLRKDRSHAEVYNDMDGEVVNLFKVLRDNGAALVSQVELTPFAREEFRQAYQECDTPLERARRTLVRSYMGFGSAGASGQSTGFRANSNRSHKTPAHDWASFPAALATIVNRFRGVVIENRDALQVMHHHDAVTTLHYVDPPYVHSTRNLRTRAPAYRHEMSDDDHRHLAAGLRALHGMVVLSGYPCELYDQELFADWERHECRAMADGAKERTEVIWLNPACSQALQRNRTQPDLLEACTL